MSLELRILTGARAGQREVFIGPNVTAGRHPSSSLRFDPDRDRDVSSRHAELRLVDGRWMLRDIGSTNGTLVNGKRVSGERELADGDVIAFGEEGPQVEVRLAGRASVPGTIVSPSHGAATLRPSAPRGPGSTTREQIRIAVSQQTRSLRFLLVAAIATIVVGVGGAIWLNASSARQARQQIASLTALNDSLERTFRESMSAVRGDLEAALAAERKEVEALRARIRTARGDAEVEALSRELSQLEQKRHALLSGNYPLIDSLNRRAVVMVAVEKADGTVEGGSGFAVSRNGHIVTNRHVVFGASNDQPRRIAVIFNDTRDWRPATLVTTDTEADLALLQVADGDPTPVVAGIAPSRQSVRVGSPVAIIGYPLSLDTPMPGSGMNVTAASTLGPGTVSKILDDVVQIDAFAGTGSSGSPLFDGRGNVIGVIYGGARDSGGRIVYAVPSERLLGMLPAELRARMLK